MIRNFHKKEENKGFTLVEILIAIGIFSFVSLLVTSSFLNLNTAQKKNYNAQAILNELRFSIDLMGKEITSGSAFPAGCENGCDSIVFASKVRPDVPLRRIEYYLDADTGTIMKGEQKTFGTCSILPLASECYQPFTSPSVKVDTLKFFVNNKGDYQQPIITVSLHGTILPGSKDEKEFDISTSFSPRLMQDPDALPPADNQPPEIQITSPTTDDTYSTNESSIVLAGTASDNVGVKEVLWRNESIPPDEYIDSASARDYIYVKVGADACYSGYALYNFNVSSAGYHKFWGRAIAEGGTSDSFYFYIDEGERKTWYVPQGTAWHWDDFESIYLSQGNHTLKIRCREQGTRLDRILITNDYSFIPSQSEENPSKEYIWMEAESGDLVEPMKTATANAAQGFASQTSPGFATWETPAIPLLTSATNVLVVEARDADGNVNTDTLTVQSTALPPAPYIYNAYRSCYNGDERASIAWWQEAPYGPGDKYHIYKCQGSGCNPEGKYYTTKLYREGAEDRWLIDSNVNVGQTYCYKVKGYLSSTGQYSDYSNKRCVPISACPPPVGGNGGNGGGGGGGDQREKDFSLSASPTIISVGVSGSSTVKRVSSASKIRVNPQNGFNSSVYLTASGGPSGTEYLFNPSTLYPSSYSSGSSFRVRIPDNSSPGTYKIYITGSGGGKTATVRITLNVYVTGGGQQ